MAMGKELRARSFKSGNSIAVRMPAALGLRPGAEWQVEEREGEIVLKPVVPDEGKIDLTDIWGSIPGLTRMAFEQKERDWDRGIADHG
jgi:antitoxin VapB